jgi:hypothetical protein
MAFHSCRSSASRVPFLAALLSAGAAVAQTAPASAPAPAPAPAAPSTATTDSDRLLQAVQAAQEAAKAAEKAAEAAQKAAEALTGGPVQKPAEAAKVAEAPKPPTPAAPPKPLWTGHVGLNLLSVTGNANTFVGKLGGQIEGDFTKWTVLLKADASYGQATAADVTSVTALNAEVLARGDRSISDNFAAYLQGGTGTDHIASIELLSFAEAGVAITWLERKTDDFIRARIRTDVGFRYSHEQDFQYYPEALFLDDRNIFALRVAGSFRYAMSKATYVTEDIEVMPDVVVSQDVRVTSVTAVNAEINKGLAVNLGFKVRYQGVPATGSKPTDTELGAGINYSF